MKECNSEAVFYDSAPRSQCRAPSISRIILNIDECNLCTTLGLVNKSETIEDRTGLSEKLARGGFRVTPQRQHVYEVLLNHRDHPTAEEVFIRAKHGMPDISLATVYNCLDALVACEMVRQVNLDRAATRYCPNMSEHMHFYCDGCGQVFDVTWSARSPQAAVALPKGFHPAHVEVAIRGQCPACSGKSSKS
jgi:Fur family transcriptional regulator, peroxide stress response regulator